jgi:predicted transcriptional regulator
MGPDRFTLPPLGELELAALEQLWTAGEADVEAVHTAVGRSRGITANTVGSALERLFKKGLAERRKVSHAYRYRAALTREAFAARRMLEATGGVATLTKSGLLAAFVDLLGETDQDSLDRLAELVRTKKREREQA